MTDGMGLSSNVIWHQTTFEGLKAIIEEMRFKCSYSLETIKWKSYFFEMAFPMVSFCDIPISDTLEYLGKYGNYTIGLKRSWGKKVNLSPVWYRAPTASSLCLQMERSQNLQNNPYNNDIIKENENLWNILSYTKNFEGKLLKRKYESYRFYDEREIRYVPALQELMDKSVKPMLDTKKYTEYRKDKKTKKTIINNIFLPFEVSDICYILVSEDSKINGVKKLFAKKDISKIVFLSHRQIKQDIIGLSHNRKV